MRDNSRYYFLIPLAAFMAVTALLVLRKNRKASTTR
jgi:preprotein translocase subunit YajC